MNRTDLFIMIALVAAIAMFVDFKPPMRVLDTVIAALAAVWIALTLYRWFRKNRD